MDLVYAPVGRPTTTEVRRAITNAKAGDPLRAVRVVVPSNLAGLSLRRLLGSRLLDGPDNTLVPAGLANVQFSTPFQLASLVAAPVLASSGQRPLTTAVLAAAVRHVLATNPGRFSAVAEHVATESALIRAYGEITELPPERRQALAASSSARTQELLEVINAVDAHLHGGSGHRYHDEYTVLSEAASLIGQPASGLADETLVYVGPFTQGLATLEFLSHAARSRVGGRAVWALTGDESVDRAAAEQAATILGEDAVASVTLSQRLSMPVPNSFLPAADPDEEVRAVVREVLHAADRGVKFDRMAVFVPARAPYLRSLREQLDAAGVPSAGPDHRTLADSMTGRLLLRLLSLADSATTTARERRFDRETVLALVEAAPLRGPDGRPIRSGPWENISRKAGVVAGLDEWVMRLAAFTQSLTKRIDDASPEASSAFLDGLVREREATVALGAFVEWLAELTSPTAVGRTWAERSVWARTTLAALLPPENRRNGWPEIEIDAAERVDTILHRVGVLDSIEPNLTAAAFLRAIQLELDVPGGRRGRFGTGVLVAPLASAVGLDLDEVFIVGMAEGTCPRPIREDTLLPDAERQLTGGALALRADKNREERQRYLHAVGSGASVTLVSPVGDHRNGRERTASRWWVEALRVVTGDASISSEDWGASAPIVDQRRRSFAESLTSAVFSNIATSASDLQLHYVHADARLDGDVDVTAFAGPLRRGLTQTSERLNGFNRFTGDLTHVEVESPLADDRTISPSRLESWATCPRRFYFEQLLRLSEIDRPEEIVEMSALDRGSLWHEILEDFIGESTPNGEHTIDDPDYRWTDADRDRLFAHAKARYDEYEKLGRTGRDILWAIRVEETNADLDAFLRADNDLRTELRSTPHDVELRFGLAAPTGETSANAAEVVLDNGRTVRLGGLIDRVDMRSDGVPVVLDYKTGKVGQSSGQKQLDADPVLGGRKLQLGVYAEAVNQHFGTDSAQAYYWHTSAKGGFKHLGYPWNPERRERFVDAVSTIVDGIERGDFPPNPGDYNAFYGSYSNCNFCAFTRICPVDRDEEFEQAVMSGRLVDYVTMQNPPEPDEGEGGS